MEIPKACFDPKLSIIEIKDMMRSSYLNEEQIRLTAGSDNWKDKLIAEMKLQCFLDIDAKIIYMINNIGLG